jgi:hypothetical protein
MYLYNLSMHIRLHAYIFLFFTALYLLLDSETHFGCDNTVTNAVYYAITTHSTTGYGDITAQTTTAKWISMAHMLAVWIVVSMTVFIQVPGKSA